MLHHVHQLFANSVCCLPWAGCVQLAHSTTYFCRNLQTNIWKTKKKNINHQMWRENVQFVCALCRWCRPVGVDRLWPSSHTGVVCSSMWSLRPWPGLKMMIWVSLTESGLLPWLKASVHFLFVVLGVAFTVMRMLYCHVKRELSSRAWRQVPGLYF